MHEVLTIHITLKVKTIQYGFIKIANILLSRYNSNLNIII